MKIELSTVDKSFFMKMECECKTQNYILQIEIDSDIYFITNGVTTTTDQNDLVCTCGKLLLSKSIVTQLKPAYNLNGLASLSVFLKQLGLAEVTCTQSKLPLERSKPQEPEQPLSTPIKNNIKNIFQKAKSVLNKSAVFVLGAVKTHNKKGLHHDS